MMVGDTSKNFIGLKPSVDVSNADQSVSRNRDSSVVLELPENMVNGKVHQMFEEWVLPLHRDTEFV